MEQQAKRKSSKIVPDSDALEFIVGIENLELFLEEDDKWNFHDSRIHSIGWNDGNQALDIAIKPKWWPDIEGYSEDKIVILDFHFQSVEIFDLKSNSYGDIFELEITYKDGFLDCIINGYSMEVTAKRLIIDKPRLVEIQSNDMSI